jgi:CHRD domain
MTILLTTLLISSLGIVLLLTGSDRIADGSNNEQVYYANLSGTSELPSVSSDAKGISEFKFDDNKNIRYRLNVSGLDNVIAAHIHRGNEYVNGPVVLTLYKATKSPSSLNRILLFEGNATSSDLQGPLAGKQLSDLVKIIAEGKAYVNFHTNKFPYGEIRGTITNSTLAQTANNVTALKQTIKNLTATLQNLHQYKAPIFVWNNTVLKRGEAISPVLNQTAIKMPDGMVEKDKAIVVSRGNWTTTSKGLEFIQHPRGSWFMIKLIERGEEKAIATGELLKTGAGIADSCTKPPPPPPPWVAVVSLQSFNCYFQVFLTDDDGVRVVWTMLHPENEMESKVEHSGH